MAYVISCDLRYDKGCEGLQIGDNCLQCGRPVEPMPVCPICANCGRRTLAAQEICDHCRYDCRQCGKPLETVGDFALTCFTCRGDA